MTSETSTRYGSRVLRHGRSRAERAYQARSRRVKLSLCRAKVLAPLTPSRTLVLTPCPPLARGSSPPDPLSHVVLTPCPPLPAGAGGRRLGLSFPLFTGVPLPIPPQ